MNEEPVRLAVWSGPRNISTALMRAWENRPDCVVVDEPLYAAYLALTGIDHPGSQQVLDAGPTDWREALAALGAAVPAGVRVRALSPALGLLDVGSIAALSSGRGDRRLVSVELRARDARSRVVYALRYRVALVRVDRWYVASVNESPKEG